MGVSESAKQQRTKEKMFRPSRNGEDDDAPQAVLTDDQREAVCSDEDGMKLLSADPHLVSDCILMKRMSRPAADILQKFYLKLMDHSTSADSTPITARQLESLVEPRKMSIYREEAIEALIEALRRKEFPSIQTMALDALIPTQKLGCSRLHD
ncbi:hypothetical protein QQ045_015181 [Rhodiola kirilowii]